jgi:cell division septation protein DedD
MGLFVALLLALGVAFFFGLMAGLSGRPAAGSDGAPLAVAATATTPEAPAPVETGVPAAGRTFDAPSRTLLAGAPPAPGGPATEPSPPPTLQSFDDGGGESPGTAPPERPAASSARAPGAEAPEAGAGSVWVQVASLSSREEAAALRTRLARHGFPARVLPAAGPKGKVYRVRVGPYRSEDEAGRAASRLSKQEKIRGPWIVPEGK